MLALRDSPPDFARLRSEPCLDLSRWPRVPWYELRTIQAWYPLGSSFLFGLALGADRVDEQVTHGQRGRGEGLRSEVDAKLAVAHLVGAREGGSQIATRFARFHVTTDVRAEKWSCSHFKLFKGSA